MDYTDDELNQNTHCTLELHFHLWNIVHLMIFEVRLYLSFNFIIIEILYSFETVLWLPVQFCVNFENKFNINCNENQRKGKIRF